VSIRGNEHGVMGWTREHRYLKPCTYM